MRSFIRIYLRAIRHRRAVFARAFLFYISFRYAYSIPMDERRRCTRRGWCVVIDPRAFATRGMSVNNEARRGSTRDLDPRYAIDRIERPGAAAPFCRAAPFSREKRGKKKKDRSREGFPRVDEEETFANAEKHGRRGRNSRGAASVKNCIFSCQKIGGGRRGGGEEEEEDEEPRRRPPSSPSLPRSPLPRMRTVFDTAPTDRI